MQSSLLRHSRLRNSDQSLLKGSCNQCNAFQAAVAIASSGADQHNHLPPPSWVNPLQLRGKPASTAPGRVFWQQMKASASWPEISRKQKQPELAL